MQIVLVHWFIVEGREADLHRFWDEHAPGPDTQGFIDETLSEVSEQDELGTTKFINVARWQDRHDFEREFGEQPGERMDFERRLRIRVWLDPLKSHEGLTSPG